MKVGADQRVSARHAEHAPASLAEHAVQPALQAEHTPDVLKNADGHSGAHPASPTSTSGAAHAVHDEGADDEHEARGRDDRA